MSTIRIEKRRGYFNASNEPFQDKTLSWEARGIIGYLLSKPDNWHTSVRLLVTQGPASKNKIARILRELADAGYIYRERIRKDDGTFEWTFTLYETKDLNPHIWGDDATMSPESGHGSTMSPKSMSGLSRHGKRGQLINTDSITTEEQKEHEGAQAPQPRPDKPAAVLLFKRIAHRNPPKRLEDTIGRVIGEDFTDLLRWGRIIREWDARGYNRTNYFGMLDVFKNGWKEKQAKNGKGVSKGMAALQAAYADTFAEA